MRRCLFLVLGLLLLASCSSDELMTYSFSEEMTASFSGERPDELFKDPDDVADARATFKEVLKKSGNSTRGKRVLYEKWVDEIGANNVLDVIQEIWPLCHAEGHDAGKIIYDRVQDIGLGLRICADACYSGCMHGVLMEAFAGLEDPSDIDEHIDPEQLASLMGEICERTDAMQRSYSPGDCAHGVGHALMVLAEYDIDPAIDYCDRFTSAHMRYYCATGAYMEYVSEKDALDVATGKRALYPCDIGRYPAACARYKMAHVIRRLVQQKSDVWKLVRSCNQLQGAYRLGCYHGAGNGFMGTIAAGETTLQEVCGSGSDEERYVCIEGAMERMAKFHPHEALGVCASLERASEDRATCLAAVKRGMYDMQKDLTLYLGEVLPEPL